MKMLEVCRYFAFWAKDYLTGSKIKKALSVIIGIENMRPNDAIYAHQLKALKKLLEHARSTVPYYVSNQLISTGGV